MTSCPVCGIMVDENTAPSFEYMGKKILFHEPDTKRYV
jgi:YHS domain-containing protein